MTAEGEVYMFEGWSKPLHAAHAAAAAMGRHSHSILSAAAPSGSGALAKTPSQTCMLGSSPDGASSIQARLSACAAWFLFSRPTKAARLLF